MDIAYSDRIKSLAPSAIREILKVTQNADVISFAAGNPGAESFPVKEMAEISAGIYASRASSALQYGISEGYTPLRINTAKRMKDKFGIGADFDDTMIVSGGQQGIELAAKIFANEGDTIICETPSFIGALNAFRSYKLNLTGIPMEKDGIDVDALENTLKMDKRVKLLYVIPTFQNPSGGTMSFEKRKRILELAEKYNFFILEDSPYFELRYSGEDIPTIKSLDKTGRVIFVGSYSKTIAPGIRVGYVIARKEIISKLTVAKQVSDVHTNLFFSILINEYITKYDFNAHISFVRGIYREKRDTMAAAIAEFFPKALVSNVPDGGLFFWATLPDGFDGMELCRRASAKNVAAVPGVSFSVNGSETAASIRLNFSLPTHEQIRRGIEILGNTAKDYLEVR